MTDIATIEATYDPDNFFRSKPQHQARLKEEPMLCAHTVRRLKPGTFDQFSEAFMPSEDEAPPGWVRFHMLRGLADENEVVTFGFFDGTLEQLELSQHEADFERRREAIDPYVDAVIVNGVYEIVTTLVPGDPATR